MNLNNQKAQNSSTQNNSLRATPRSAFSPKYDLKATLSPSDQKAMLQRKSTFNAAFKDLQGHKKGSSTSGKSKLKLEYEEYLQKMKYRDFLFDLVEKKVKLRRQHQRMMKVARLREEDEA